MPSTRRKSYLNSTADAQRLFTEYYKSHSTIIYIEEHLRLVHGGVGKRDIS